MIRSFFLFLGTIGAFVLPKEISAFSYFDVGPTLGLSGQDPETSIIQILTWILGLLSLIATIMMIYGGITWLTSGGNEERVVTAKKIISAAVIGLAVIILSWAILTLTVNVLTTGSGGYIPQTGGKGGQSGQTCSSQGGQCEVGPNCSSGNQISGNFPDCPGGICCIQSGGGQTCSDQGGICRPSSCNFGESQISGSCPNIFDVCCQ